MTQQALQKEAESVIDGDDDSPPSPVDINLDTGEVTDAVETPAAPAKQEGQKAPLPRAQAKIQNLTHELSNERTTRERLERELLESRNQAAEAQRGRDKAERDGMVNLVQRTKAEVASAKAALVAAKDSGDTSAEVEAQARLARAAAEEADADAWSASLPKEPDNNQQQQQTRQPEQQQQQPMKPLSPAVRDFIQDNPWFSVVEIGQDGRPIRGAQNPEYDEEMHDVAMIENKKIMREVSRGGLDKSYIESPEYFARITAKVKAEFPDAFEAEEEEQPTQRRAPKMEGVRQPVAPPSKNIPGQQQQKQGTKMRLDGEEAALVRSLVDSGTLNYPRDHKDATKRGQRMSYEDAYVKYAREKQTDQANRG